MGKQRALEQFRKATVRAEVSAEKAQQEVERARERAATCKSPEARQKAKAALERKQENAKKKAAAASRAKAAEQKKQQDEEHLQQLLAPETHTPGEEGGCVTRGTGRGPCCEVQGHNYRENGFKFQSGGSEKSWYNLDFSQEGAARERFEAYLVPGLHGSDPRQPHQASDWWMGAGPNAGVNFQVPGQPWVWNAHHIITLGELKRLELWMRLALQTGKYNVHKGLNILFLPVFYTHGKAYQLPTHPQSGNGAIRFHVKYSQLVRKKINEIYRMLLEIRQTKQDGHPELSDLEMSRPKSELEMFSKKMRGAIRELGVESVEAQVHLNQLPDFIKKRPEFASLFTKI